MRSWLVARWRVVIPVAVVVFVALVATIAIVVPTLDSRSDSVAEDFDCTRLEEASFDEAGPKARGCDLEVEVTSERTPWATSWATPDGTTRLEVSAVPVRAMVDDEWVEVDTALASDDGAETIAPEAPVYPMEFSAGTAGVPLGTIEREGNQLDVGFPLALPEPSMVDSTAVYELGEGIRLLVTVNTDGTGFLPVVELASPDAGRRFQAALHATDGSANAPGTPIKVAFDLGLSDGLVLDLFANGAVEVTDSDGDVQFVASQPVMWDSAGPSMEPGSAGQSLPSELRWSKAYPGDRIVELDTSVAGNVLTLSVDEDLLEAGDTVWPVYVDPSFNGSPAAERIAIRTGGYTGTLYAWENVSPSSPGEGAGYCSQTSTCNTVFTQRLAWKFNGLAAIAALAEANIVSASFRVYGEHSYDCSAQRTDLVIVGEVSAGSTWAGLAPTFTDDAAVGSRWEPHSVACGGQGYRSFTATAAVKTLARLDWPHLPLGLYVNESSMVSWKRFRSDATLSVEYNRVPNPPSSLQITNPAQPACTTSSQLINSLTPTLSAIVSDPDATLVSPHFQVYKKSGTTETEVWNSTTLAGQQSGTRVSATVAADKLLPDTQYFWRATSVDTGGFWSGWGPSCAFTVDTTVPVTPTVTPEASGTGVQAVYQSGFERGGVEMPGKFTLYRGTSTDVVNFAYGFDDPLTQKRSPNVDSNGYAVIDFPALKAGSVVLTVKSIDRANNRSDETTYSFDVAAPTEDAIWNLDENTGTTARNSGPLDVGPLKLAGPGWVEGPHQLFRSRDGDWALRFDGTNDLAAGDTVLDTRKSFTVTAHVRLDEAKRRQGDFTALSQDGLTQSAFRLGYRRDCGGGKECWSFSMPDSSTGTAMTSATVPLDSLPQVEGQWMHLVGEHNVTADTVRIWVCPVGTPDQPTTGAPVNSDPVIRPGSPWQGPGGFTLGRGLTAGAAANWWPGEIDNVRLFSGQITDAAKLRRLCQGAEVADFGEGAAAFDAADPTVSEK